MYHRIMIKLFPLRHLPSLVSVFFFSLQAQLKYLHCIAISYLILQQNPMKMRSICFILNALKVVYVSRSFNNWDIMKVLIYLP